MDEEFLREVIEYKKRKLGIIFIFFALMVIPFVYSIINFLNLKDCESKESNGCPQLFLPDTTSTGAPTTSYIEYSTNQHIIKSF